MLWKCFDQVQQVQIVVGVDVYWWGDFSVVQVQFEGVDIDVGWYNFGNVFVCQGQYDVVIDVYDCVLVKYFGMFDVVVNCVVVDVVCKCRLLLFLLLDLGKLQFG